MIGELYGGPYDGAVARSFGLIRFAPTEYGFDVVVNVTPDVTYEDGTLTIAGEHVYVLDDNVFKWQGYQRKPAS